MIWRKIGFALICLLLLLTAYNGLREGLNMISYATGAGQWAATLTQLIYGVSAVLTLSAMGARHRLATPFLYAWCVATTLVSALAPVVYGGTSIGIGIMSGAAAALVAALVFWIWRRSPLYLSLPTGNSSGQPRRAQSSNEPS